MQVRTGRVSAGAHFSHHGALLDAIAPAHAVAAMVRVQSREPALVGDHHEPSIAAVPTAERHLTGLCGPHDRSAGRSEVEPPVESLAAPPERRRDPARERPGEPHPGRPRLCDRDVATLDLAGQKLVVVDLRTVERRHSGRPEARRRQQRSDRGRPFRIGNDETGAGFDRPHVANTIGRQHAAHRDPVVRGDAIDALALAHGVHRLGRARTPEHEPQESHTSNLRSAPPHTPADSN